jgi:hypothetical protein
MSIWDTDVDKQQSTRAPQYSRNSVVEGGEYTPMFKVSTGLIELQTRIKLAAISKSYRSIAILRIAGNAHWTRISEESLLTSSL